MITHVITGAFLALFCSLAYPSKMLHAIPEDNCTNHVECKPQCTASDGLSATITRNFDAYDGTCYCDDHTCQPDNGCEVSYTVTITPLPGEHHSWAANPSFPPCEGSQYTIQVSQTSGIFSGSGCTTASWMPIFIYSSDDCEVSTWLKTEAIDAKCNRLVLQRCDQRSC